ncbi:hypothetical protein Z947_1703 [Sulfitobacter geojensis]|nr:hypothetical protein Z947_1703 [Sulfitobacter geojensis]
MKILCCRRCCSRKSHCQSDGANTSVFCEHLVSSHVLSSVVRISHWGYDCLFAHKKPNEICSFDAKKPNSGIHNSARAPNTLKYIEIRKPMGFMLPFSTPRRPRNRPERAVADSNTWRKQPIFGHLSVFTMCKTKKLDLYLSTDTICKTATTGTGDHDGSTKQRAFQEYIQSVVARHRLWNPVWGSTYQRPEYRRSLWCIAHPRKRGT